MKEIWERLAGSYVFWLTVLSVSCLVAERVRPWRREQALWRREFSQDLFWLVFNGALAGIVLAGLLRPIQAALAAGFSAAFGRPPESLALVGQAPLWMQAAVVLLLADLLEWCVHNGLHRIGWLWKFHRMHHSIVIMDWIGNFRFHWMEIVVYSVIKHLPLALLGARWEALLTVAVISTAIGNLNHANLNISWGPLRYVLNSPRMHIWHHEKQLRGKAGVNFAVVFSLWDWLFGTAFMPQAVMQPDALGYGGMERVSSSLPMRFFLPMIDTAARK